MRCVEYLGRVRSVKITVKDIPSPNQDDWVLSHPLEAPEVEHYASQATKWAQHNDAALGGGNHNGRGDAARHAYWNALITKHLGGYIASGATTSHERLALEQGQSGVRYNETVMDMENNEVGRGGTLSGASDADMLSTIKLLNKTPS